MQNFISGLDEIAARALIGEQAWHRAGASWIDPDHLVETLASRPGAPGARTLWLYRSPMDELLCAGEANGELRAPAVLALWHARNHAALDLHRRGAGITTLVNAGLVDRLGLPPGWFGDDAVDRGPTAATDATADVLAGMLQRILAFDAPEHIELFELLEASSWLPDGQDPDFLGSDLEPASGNPGELLDAVVAMAGNDRRVAELESDRERQQRQWDADREKLADALRENELLVLQLRSLHDDARRIASNDQTAALRAQLEALKSQDRLLRMQVGKLHALLAGSGAPGLRARVAGRLAPSNELALARIERATQIDAIRRSDWFDAEWYLKANDDVRASSTDPAAHYHDWGWLEGRDPGPRFSTTGYLREYPDVAESGLDPLWHFIRFGEQEGRQPIASGS